MIESYINIEGERKGRLPLSMRKRVYLGLIFAWLSPIVAMTCFPSKNLFLLIASTSVSCSVWLIYFWEKKMHDALHSLVNERVVQAVEEEKLTLRANLLEKEEQFHKIRLALEDARQEINHLKEDQAREFVELTSKIKENESLISEYQITIRDQRSLLEKKQQKIIKLEKRNAELTYEIRSLLDLEERPKRGDSNFFVEVAPPLFTKEISFFDLSRELENSIKIAEEFSPHPVSSPYLELSEERSFLDLPNFISKLPEEKKLLFVIYSPKERRILFVHPSACSLIGWGTEKLAKFFFHLMLRGIGEWKEALTKLSKEREAPLHLALRDREGKERLFQGLLGPIRKGPLSGLVIGLFSEVPPLSNS